MKKNILLFLVCSCLLSCSKDNNIEISDPWALRYPWLKEIMLDAESGNYKDANGKRALVSIYVLDTAERPYFLFHYGMTDMMYDEIRDHEGNVLQNQDVDLDFNPERIYPFGLKEAGL